MICGVTLSETVEPLLWLVRGSSQMELQDVTERTCACHCLESRFYAATTVLWTLRGPCVSLVMNDLCGIRIGWIPADFTLHQSWARVGLASWATGLPCGDRALPARASQASKLSQVKSLLQISVFFFCLIEGMCKQLFSRFVRYLYKRRELSILTQHSLSVTKQTLVSFIFLWSCLHLLPISLLFHGFTPARPGWDVQSMAPHRSEMCVLHCGKRTLD